jgi:hypothetical protein
MHNLWRVSNLCMVYSVCLPSVQNTERVANLCMVICIITVTVFVQSLKSYCIHIEDGHLLFWTDLNNFSNKNFDVLNLVIFVITCCREYLVCVICNCIFQFNIIFKSCTHIEVLYIFLICIQSQCKVRMLFNENFCSHRFCKQWNSTTCNDKNVKVQS